ncbi:unnamed protein product [Calicophoron daubneyi]|uniref:Uncharacterized protein n=1 Tax=Calicophoron daubneyi TaxID=300641 RepID=A0AAV2TPN5_CALDB
MSHDQAPRIQHVQPGVSAYNSVCREALDYLNGAILQMSSCPNLFTTKTTAAELQKAADYLAQIRLEDQLFSNATASWRERFSERELVTQRQALLNLKNKLSDPGGQFLPRYRTNMDHGNVRCTSDTCGTKEVTKRTLEEDGIGWTDTSVRAAHAWAEQELKDLNKELEPLAKAAQKRMEQYLDEVDITDRFSGYRRNMGYLRRRNPEDIKALENTLNTSIRPPVAPRWHLGLDWERAEAVGTQNYSAPGDNNDCHVDQTAFMKRYDAKEDPRKKAGIEIHYPGRSEYQDRYLIPSLVEVGEAETVPPATHRATFEQPPGVRGRGLQVGIDPMQVHNKGYGVNPAPNYYRDFDPGPKPDKSDLEYPKSEAKTKYTWPKIESNEPLPWVIE